MEEGDKTLSIGLHDEINNNNNNNNNNIKEKEKKKEMSSIISRDNHQVVVRSRWSPKPEQILILESIFNKGMVNPPKEETARIRKLLEKFGSVGDANVFYWFQNRRSRSRRRHRQIVSMQMQQQQFQHQHQHQHQQHDLMVAPSSSENSLHGNNSCYINTANHHHHNLFPLLLSAHQTPETIEPAASSSSISLMCPPTVHFQSPELMTVFINGVATEVPKGPIEVKPIFGDDVVLVHSSGLPIPTNEFGILLQTLHPGESYFLVPRPALIK